MKREFVKAEVQVIKFECQDVLTGPSANVEGHTWTSFNPPVAGYSGFWGYSTIGKNAQIIKDSNFKYNPSENKFYRYLDTLNVQPLKPEGGWYSSEIQDALSSCQS